MESFQICILHNILPSFLAQSDMTEDTSYWDKSDNTKHNPITQNFNKAIKNVWSMYTKIK